MIKKLILTVGLLIMSMFMLISCSGENSLTGGSFVDLEVESTDDVEDNSEDTNTNEEVCEVCEETYNECQITCESETSGEDLNFCLGVCDYKYCYCSEKECVSVPSVC